MVLSVLVTSAFAHRHDSLNGTWTLMPDRSDFAGGSPITAGTITIYDRQGNIYISRNFTYAAGNETISYSFSTDGGEGSSIHEGKSFKSKARWEGDVLRVTTTQSAGGTTIERYSAGPEGVLTLTFERPGQRPIALAFARQ